MALLSTTISGTSPSTVTVSIATPCVVTWASHGFLAGQGIQFFTTGALPTGLSILTTYYIMSTGFALGSFQISATLGGSAINTSGSQSGTHSACGVLNTLADTVPVTSFSSAAITNPTSVLTRPANTTAYAVNQFIGSSTTAGSCVVPSFAISTTAGGVILSCLRLSTNVTTGWNNAGILVTLWKTAPTYSTGDGGAYTVTTGAAGWLADSTVTLKQYADGAVYRAQISVGNELAVALASGTSVFWDMQILSAATPISGQTFTLTAELLN